MKLTLEPGLYVVAVSGGVDSMVLLDLLRRDSSLELVVAHYDHGIRADSDKDRQLVEQVAAKHKLKFRSAEGRLGTAASEALAREARYAFLEKVRHDTKARAIVTAHHQDDVLETAIINLLRGTGRKGLSSLKSNGALVRPMLELNKQQIRDYATKHTLQWREDSTNQDTKYLRNYIRLRLLASLNQAQKQTLLDHISTAQSLNSDIDGLLQLQLAKHGNQQEINRAWFVGLPHAVAREVMASWLRAHHQNFDSKGLERLVTAAKTLPPGKRADVNKTMYLNIGKQSLALTRNDR